MCTELAQGYREPEKKMSLLKPYTNFEKIKAMDIDEMADFLCGLCADVAMLAIYGVEMRSPNKQWLESEVTENA